MTLLSRITGLVREIIGFSMFGAGSAMDAFQVAWRIPNFLRRLFAEGAFSQAFVPVLAEYRASRGEDATRALGDRVASVLAVVLFVVTVVGVIGAPLLVYATASGFAKNPAQFALTVDLVRITFPYIFFISLVALAAGILNTFSAFKTPAFTPVLLNLSVIAAALFIAPHVDPPILALAWGTFLGGVLQLIFQVPALKRVGMLPRFRWNPSDEGVVRILSLMAPALLGVSVAQISILLNTQIASFLAEGSVSWLTAADRLMEFPAAMLGVALGTVLLPSLVKQHAAEDRAAFSALLDWGLRLALVLTLPAALALALLAVPLIATLFQHGKFTAQSVIMTSHALIAYAVGLAGIILVKILAPGFYARQNIKTPVKIAIATLVVVQLCNLAFVPWLKHAGLALSTGLGACFNAGLLFYFIRRDGHYKPQGGWLVYLAKILAALVVMAAVLLVLRGSNATWITLGVAEQVGRLAMLVAIGSAAYFGTLWLLGFRVRDFIKRTAS
jgi:putative peptidoglycan lipid II flippase